MGLNEAAGYQAVSATALATGYVAARYGLRPEPFYLGLAFAGVGLGLSYLAVGETRAHADHEAAGHTADNRAGGLETGRVFIETSLRNRSLSAVSRAGLVNNLNDGMAWGLLPPFYAAAGLTVSQIGILAAVYPAVWGIGQLSTGAWSDRVGRKWVITAGMWVQSAAIAIIALGSSFGVWVAAGIALGGRNGDGLSHAAGGGRGRRPSFVAGLGGRCVPAVTRRRFRRRRDTRRGGRRRDAATAIWVVAALTFVSGLVVANRSGPSFSSGNEPCAGPRRWGWWPGRRAPGRTRSRSGP